MKKMIMLLVLMLLALPAHGLVYTWTDSAGIKHFTNKEYEVPARYRARTKSLYPEQADSGASQQNVQTTQAKPEEPIRATQPVIAPESPKPKVERATKRGRRSRGSSEDD